MVYFISILLLMLGLTAVALQRLYSAVPARELKRLAAQGDSLARAVYRPVAFGESLRLLLWVVAGASLGGGLVVFVRSAPTLISILTVFTVMAITLVGLPSLALTDKSARLAVWFAPVLSWILQRTDRPLQTSARALNRYRLRETHSRLYEKADLHDLLDRQKSQPDNRIPASELERAKRALHFSDRRAADVALSRKKFRAIEAHETLGPILLDELHASNQTSFLVFDGTFENIVGVLALSDALKAKQGGQVSGAMRPSITYVHESFTLPEVLSALTATGQQVAVVVNAFGEMVGIITLQQLVSELAGELPAHTVPYDDRAGIAASKSTFEAPVSSQETSEAIEAELEQAEPADAEQQPTDEEPNDTEQEAASFTETPEVIE